jgi:hypothetical protein
MSTSNGSAVEPSPRKLKVLMLHGTSHLLSTFRNFHAKTSALEKALQKAFPAAPPPPHKPTPATLPSYPGGIHLIYPSGPHILSAQDIPGYTPSDLDSDTKNDWRAWWVRDNTTGEYKGMDEGFQVVADAIKKEGPIDGVIGFSQGAAGAAFVTSLLEPNRIAAFEQAMSTVGVAYPAPFLAKSEEGVESGATNRINGNQVLKFGVSYSGFFAPDPRYKAFYEPKISTPMLHFIGSLDSVVEEDRSMGLAERCEKVRVVVHPGGHFVPIGKEWVAALANFIRETCGEKVAEKEESVEDMDMPF